jgi:predicted GNAT family N-acyltransferase
VLVLKYLPNGNLLAEPSGPEDFEFLYLLRWKVLRKPWGQSKGSELDEMEASSIHRMIVGSGNNQQVLACGRMQEAGARIAQIRYMAVQEEFRGSGLGSIVLSSLEDAALNLGLVEVFLNAREPAVSFYLRCGYQMEEEIDSFLGIRHFRMRKLLGQHVA